MQLLSIETKEELVCIADLVNSIDGVGLPGEYFTSGSDYQIANNFTWCSSNYTSIGQNIAWISGEPSMTDFFGVEEDCVSVNLSLGQPKKNALRDVDCSAKKKYICEVPVPTTTKPPCLPYTCEKNQSLLDSDDYINPNASIDGALRISCGKMYYYSNLATTWQAAASACCQLNMRLVVFETVDQRNCFNKIFSIPGYGSNLNSIHLWVGFSDQYQEGVFTWCTSSRNIKITTNSLFFAGGQPDNAGNNENCGMILANTGAALNDGNCMANLRFACEGYVPDCTPICPSTCAKDSEPVIGRGFLWNLDNS
ncbi:macrophage mannose receptor 1-like [Neocloeon triangulifer]|uniref:macrophage mannose receptor 1-like n=1 Tax=Neocloeon triangulifer TaxID=2078957 RepID=UPI00286EDD62|nr:macrophage mannose receptor 1-like [Neocloeon triangulifer]